jgi:hypothetical protein
VRLGHKLVDVVVVAVVYAVDVVEPTVPTCPLPVTEPPFGERRYPNIIGIQTVAEVEILYLYPMLTGCYGINDVLVLADGSKRGIILDPSQHVRYTCLDHEGSSRGPGSGVLLAPPGPSLYPTPLLYNIVLYLSTDCGNIL